MLWETKIDVETKKTCYGEKKFMWKQKINMLWETNTHNMGNKNTCCDSEVLNL